MRWVRNKWTWILAPVWGALAFPAAGSSTAGYVPYLKYTIQQGDTLGQVLRALGQKGLWGREGLVSKTVAINRKTISGPRDLEPGAQILLPLTGLPRSSRYEIKGSREVFLTCPGFRSGNRESDKVADGDWLLYRVQPGDSLATVFKRLGVRDIWGPRGMVLKTVQLNPDTVGDRGSTLRVGSRIKLPIEPEDLLPSLAYHVDDSGELDWGPASETKAEFASVSVQAPRPQELESATRQLLVSQLDEIDPAERPAQLLYRVRRGDQIGWVLHRLGIGPIWGEKGAYLQTCRLNREVLSQDCSLVPNTWIRLPVEHLPESSAYRVLDSGEVELLATG